MELLKMVYLNMFELNINADGDKDVIQNDYNRAINWYCFLSIISFPMDRRFKFLVQTGHSTLFDCYNIQ